MWREDFAKSIRERMEFSTTKFEGHGFPAFSGGNCVAIPGNGSAEFMQFGNAIIPDFG